MPIFELSDELVFPHPSLAEEGGLLAVGGDLSPQRLLLAYSNGIFPWFEKEDPILWWSPNPRCVLFPNKLNIPKSLRKFLRTHNFNVKFDTNCQAVISNCATAKRKGQIEGTWITPEMQSAYLKLHQLGYVHSVEVYQNEDLVGGLYGVAIGKVFFGESMFHKVTNASKLAFVTLVIHLQHWEFEIIDNQQTTPLLLQFGSEEIDRESFLSIVSRAVKKVDQPGKWTIIDGYDKKLRSLTA
ncbi:MAG: leucyl/phenylalanyl-tRNA--protein transferase [Bacteroidales bacterium]|nr:leucyl/phenylalanyl-tRNA--protein transferase [Bacteroidales bacterium]